MEKRGNSISRRRFIKTGSVILAGSAWGMTEAQETTQKSEEVDKINQYRTLGRTGFQASDISMGCTRSRESNVFRYAYDKGINYFDTAESYVGGKSEKILGDALKFMDRKKIFITTKLILESEENKESILERFRKCQERLQTEYVDCLFMHSVKDVKLLDHAGFHEAVKELKSQGKLRFYGVSSHGPRQEDQDSMEKVLTAAAADGRFDLMLLVYNFMNSEAGENILKACKKNNVGTTDMKTAPGALKAEPVEPENLTADQEKLIKRYQQRGMTEEGALQRLQRRARERQESVEKTVPFAKKHNLSSEEQLKLTSIQWVLQNPDMHSVCISFSDFTQVDQTIPLSGSKMSQIERRFLHDYGTLLNTSYCRHGCNQCLSVCPHQLPVNSIFRYAYYFQNQGREKDAMEKYARLRGTNASLCADCGAPCLIKCPHGLDVQAHLMQAHSLLTLV
jgi:predicted aldo/keto reductase-like oxidoreductase